MPKFLFQDLAILLRFDSAANFRIVASLVYGTKCHSVSHPDAGAAGRTE